jgi:hypothetical protein
MDLSISARLEGGSFSINVQATYDENSSTIKPTENNQFSFKSKLTNANIMKFPKSIKIC